MEDDSEDSPDFLPADDGYNDEPPDRVDSDKDNAEDIDVQKLLSKDFGSNDGFGHSEPFQSAGPDLTPTAIVKKEVSASDLQDLDRTLMDCQLRANRSRNLGDTMKQPWEKGYMGLVFGGQLGKSMLNPSWLSTPVRIPDIIKPAASSSSSGSAEKVPANWKRPVISSAVLKVRRMDTKEFVGDPLRFRALSRWRAIVALDLNSSVLGRQLTDFYLDGRAESVILQILEDTLSKKSTSTLNKRSSSLMKYIGFIRQHYRATGLQFRENWVYSYVCKLREQKSAPTAPKSFLEAMTLSITLIGADVEDPGWKSSRVSGAAASMYVQKAALKQAEPLTVLQVKLLHHVVENAQLAYDVVLAGYMLFCVYACCRWSDPQNAVRCQVDIVDGAGYLELGTKDHKMANTEQRKTLIMPLVATCPGLGKLSPCWVDLWITARESLGLKFITMPTMPTRTNAGTWTTEAMSASEGSSCLRGVLEAYGSKLRVGNKTTSHALKSTGLSWCAKRPIKKDFRRALGHHIDSNDQSVSIYSRDFMFAPLLAFDFLLAEILAGHFCPDSSRAERSRQTTKPVKEAQLSAKKPRLADTSRSQCAVETGLEQLKTAPGADAESHSSDSSSDSSSNSSSDESIPEPAVEEARLFDLGLVAPVERREMFTDANGDEIQIFQHNCSGTLHAKATDAKLVCGRIISRSYSKVVKQLLLKWPKCSACDSKCANPKFKLPKPKSLATASTVPVQKVQLSLA